MTKQFDAPIGNLWPNPWNANHITPDNEPKLLESIRTLGIFKPIVVREITCPDTGAEYQILGGEQRWGQAKEAGLTEVPVFNVGVIDDNLAKRITLADNARYGQDDMIELAKILEDIGSPEELQAILPYTETDINSIFSSVNIALDELELPGGFEEQEEKSTEAAPERVAKTHTIMRFKVSIADSEKLTELLTKIQKRQGFTASDALTNAGDALVHAVFSASSDNSQN